MDIQSFSSVGCVCCNVVGATFQPIYFFLAASELMAAAQTGCD